MNQNKPLNIALDLLKHQNIVVNNEYRFINSELGIVISFANLQSILLQMGQPYRIKEGRIIWVIRGTARISVNLIEYDVNPHTLIVVPLESIIELVHFSDDYDFRLIVPSNDFCPISSTDNRITIIVSPTDREWEQLETYFSLIWSATQTSVFRREVVQHLITALLYNIRYIRKIDRNNTYPKPSRQEEIFQRFITLVNKYSKQERTVGFYADKLCLTPRYLNTVIKQVSRQTVMDWINQSVILEAKVMLKHSDLLVYQISDNLNFPNPSFFCKFFKRTTGITPQEYKKK